MCHGEQGGAGEDVCVCVMVVLGGGSPPSGQPRITTATNTCFAQRFRSSCAPSDTNHSTPPQPQRWCCSNKPSSPTPVFSSVSCSLRWSREQSQAPPGSCGGNPEHSLPAPTAPELVSCSRKHPFFSGLIYSVSRAEKQSAAIWICHGVSHPVGPGETSPALSLAKFALTKGTHLADV